MTKTEAECELMAFKLDQKNVEESLKKLKNLVSAQNVHLSRKDKDDRIRYEILRQLREIPNLKNLGLIGRNFSLDELEAELKIECKLRNLHINKNNDEKKMVDKRKIKKCFGCQQPGHIKPDCPNIKKEERISNIIEELDDSNEYTIDASIMVNGLVKAVKVFPDSGSKISCINPKLVKEMGLTLSEKKRKGALADGSPINVNTIREPIELTLNGKKIKMKDVWVLEIKHDLLIGTRTLCECDFVIKWTKPIDDDKKMMTLCGEEQEVELKCEIMENFPDVWSKSDFDLGLCKFNSPDIDLSSEEIPEHKRYDPPLAMRNELANQVQMMLSTGIIKNSYKVKFVANSIPVRKKDGSVRLCQDLRVLNKIVIKDRYQTMSVRSIFRDMEKFEFASSIDITKAYWQIPLSEKNKELVGFRLGNETYAFQTLMFGLCNAPSYFQRTMDEILRGVTGVMIYLDDILILTKEGENHKNKVMEVMSLLNAANIKINIKKSFFYRKEIDFLGFTIKPEGITPREKFVKALERYKNPDTIASLRKLRGLFCFVQHLIPGAQLMTKEMNEYIGNTSKIEGKKKVILPDSVKKEVEMIIEAVKKCTGVEFVKPDRGFFLYTDASNKGVGSILCQSNAEQNVGKRGINKKSMVAVGYFSATWNSYQRPAPAVLYEMKGISYSLNHFREIIWGRPVTVLTDHKNLISLCEESTDSRYDKYLFNIMSYGPRIIWLAGIENEGADSLSRICTISINCKEDIAKIAHEIFEEYHTKRVHSCLSKIWLMCQDKLIGEGRTKREIKAICKKLRELISNCRICLEENTLRRCKPKFADVEQPFDKIYIDMTEIDGKKIVAAIDAFPNLLIVQIIKSGTGEEVKQFLITKIECQYGLPKAMHSDNAKIFTGGVVKEYCEEKNILQSFSEKYSHCTNQKIERAFSTLQLAMRKVRKESNNACWIKKLPIIVHNINSMKFKDENYGPLDLIFTYHVRADIDNKNNVSLRQKPGTESYHQVQRKINKLRTKQVVIKNTMKKGKLDNQNAMGKVIEIKNSESDYPSMIVQTNMDRRCSQIAPLDKVREVTDSGITGPLKVSGGGEKN
uniref:RNA-directed DNA polymerase n=1 Tax=Strongyloides papillosus TaxID=174720 RepID=A0A0N5B5L8_STREA